MRLWDEMLVSLIVSFLCIVVERLPAQCVSKLIESVDENQFSFNVQKL